MPYCKECGSSISGEIKFCGNCGASQLYAATNKLEVESEKTSRTSKMVCPVCGQSDSCQKVATIVDSGNSVSVGLSTFSTWSTHPVVGSGVNLSTSSTNLARRLSVNIPEATFQFGGFFAGLAITIFAIYQWAKQGNSGDSLFVAMFFSVALGLIPGALVGLIGGFWGKSIKARRIAPWRAAAGEAQRDVRSAYYCFRDDYVFNGELAGTPEEVIQELVNKYLHN